MIIYVTLVGALGLFVYGICWSCSCFGKKLNGASNRPPVYETRNPNNQTVNRCNNQDQLPYCHQLNNQHDSHYPVYLEYKDAHYNDLPSYDDLYKDTNSNP